MINYPDEENEQEDEDIAFGYQLVQIPSGDYRKHLDGRIELIFFLAELDTIDRKIIEYKHCSGFCLREIAYELGFKTHESVRKRLKNIEKKLDKLRKMVSFSMRDLPISRGDINDK